jgi:hypothetical protein
MVVWQSLTILMFAQKQQFSSGHCSVFLRSPSHNRFPSHHLELGFGKTTTTKEEQQQTIMIFRDHMTRCMTWRGVAWRVFHRPPREQK